MEFCSRCGWKVKYRDRVKRKIKSRNGKTSWVYINRYRCINPDCGFLQRELPNYILPFKLYEADVIEGVLDGYISSETLGFEDYPSEITMKRWIKWFEAISKSATIPRTYSGWLRIFMEESSMFLRKDRNVPCLNCDHRDEACHGSCEDYQEWAKARRELNEHKRQVKNNEWLSSKNWNSGSMH